MKSKKMRKYSEDEMFPSQAILKDLSTQRYVESEMVLESLIDWPGSTYDELCVLHPLQRKDMKRIVYWLEDRKCIYRENDYYFLWDKYDEEDK